MSQEPAVESSGPRGAEVEEKEERLSPVVTRREFLLGAGTGAAVTAVAAAGFVTVAKPGTAAAPAAGVPITAAPAGGRAAAPVATKLLTLKVNGQVYEVAVQARSTLADVLRYQLGLTGTKIGCNRAECGACTVLMDGNNIYSCTQMAFASEGKDIVTVESLAKDPSRLEGLHPIQQGFIVKDAPQCAFCMPGQMLSAYALLKSTPRPTEDQIKHALSGNICRCGNYNHIWDAVAWAADHMADVKVEV